jgi:hypothetical protein
VIRGETTHAARAAVQRSRQRTDRRIGLLVVATTPLAAVTLRRPDFGVELLVVTLATMAVAAAAGLAMLVAPSAFGVRSFRVGGAFVVSTHVLLLIGLPSTFARLRIDDPSGAMAFVSIILISHAIVVVGVAGFERIAPGHFGASAATISLQLWPLAAIATLTVVIFIGLNWPPAVLGALGGARGAELDELRQASFSQLQPAVLGYLFGFARAVALPFVVAALLIKALDRRDAVTISAFAAVSLVALLAVTATVEKSLVPRFALVLVIALSQPLRRRSKSMFAFGSVAFVASFAFLFLIARQANSSATSTLSLLGALIRRVVILPGEIVYEYVAFTEHEGFGRGRSIPYVSKVLPGGFRDLPAEVFDFAFPTSTLSGGHANGSFIGFFWADFGWAGIILGSVSVAVTLIILERACQSLGSSAEAQALRAVIFVQAAQLTSTSLFDSLLVFPFGLVDIVLLSVGVRFLIRRASRSSERVPKRLGPVPAPVGSRAGG